MTELLRVLKKKTGYINEFKEEKITNFTLSFFFDKVINDLKNEGLISNIIFEVYQGQIVLTKPLHSDHSQPLKQTRDEHWQKFYGFNHNIMIENILTFIAKNLKKASIKDKLYYNLVKLSDQLDLNKISDHFMNKLSNYITFNNFMKNYRTESDSFGEIQIEDKFYWGTQTQRSLENFKIGKQKNA